VTVQSTVDCEFSVNGQVKKGICVLGLDPRYEKFIPRLDVSRNGVPRIELWTYLGMRFS